MKSIQIKKSVALLILVLGLISAQLIKDQVILPNLLARLEYENAFWNNLAQPPYQYRVLEPMLAKGLQAFFAPLLSAPEPLHAAVYSLLITFVFWGIYTLLAVFLGFYFHETGVLLGLLVFQAVLPLAITGFYMEGDLYTVLFYLAVFLLMVRQQDRFIPILIFFAALNREQTIFLIFLYAVYLYTQQRLDKPHLILLALNLLIYAGVFLGVRLYFGFKPTPFTWAVHWSNNTNLYNVFLRIIPLWLAEVGGLLVYCGLAFRRSDRFLRLALLSLVPYFISFFFNGNLWEMGKFLPAYLILIPLALQVLTGEYIQLNTPLKQNSILQ